MKKMVIGSGIVLALAGGLGAAMVFGTAGDERERICGSPDVTVPAAVGAASTGFVTSPDGRYVLDHSAMVLFDARTGARVREFGQDGSLVRPGFTPDGRLMAAHGRLRTVVWNVETGEAVRSFPDAVAGVAISPDGARVATVADRLVRIRDVRTGEQIAELEIGPVTAGSTRPIGMVAFSPDGERLAVGDDRGEVRIWRTADWSRDQEFYIPGAGVRTLVFSPDGTRLAAIDGHGQTRTAEIASETTTRIEYFYPAQGLTFSPDGTSLILTSTTSSAFRAHPAQGVGLAEVEACERPGAAVMKPDGVTMLVVTGDGFVSYPLPS